MTVKKRKNLNTLILTRRVSGNPVKLYFPLNRYFEAIDIDEALKNLSKEKPGSRICGIKEDGTIYGVKIIEEIRNAKTYKRFSLDIGCQNNRIRKTYSINKYGFLKAYKLVLKDYFKCKKICNENDRIRFFGCLNIYLNIYNAS